LFFKLKSETQLRVSLSPLTAMLIQFFDWWKAFNILASDRLWLPFISEITTFILCCYRNHNTDYSFWFFTTHFAL